MAQPEALDALFQTWREAGPLTQRCIDIVRSSRHGDLPRWIDALAHLPKPPPANVTLGATVSAKAANQLSGGEKARLEAALRGLIPWRKGPFDLFGVVVDAEWRSDRKWARIAPAVDLSGQRVLDVGCGNGYYGWRMMAAGAASVLGIDPSLLFVMQHAAMAYYLGHARNLVLPLRIEDLPAEERFDAVFSMGVLYHRRDPAAHIRQLAHHTHAKSVLVVESLVVDGAALSLRSVGTPRGAPPSRYAAMRNVHMVPNLALLRAWLADAGFRRVEVADVSTTTPDEQRSTDWMPYHSLADALDPTDPTRTVEGYPAPTRAAIIARR